MHSEAENGPLILKVFSSFLTLCNSVDTRPNCIFCYTHLSQLIHRTLFEHEQKQNNSSCYLRKRAILNTF